MSAWRYRAAGAPSAFLAVLGLCSCAPTVELGSPRVALPPQFERAGQEVGAPAIDRWWETFGDAQLSDLITKALAENRDARSAYFRVSEARAVRDQSLSARRPTGNLAGNVERQAGKQLSGIDAFGSTAPTTTSGLSFSPSWELDLFGRLGAIGRGARATYVAAAYDYYAARITVAADVATALFTARGLAVQRDDAQETLRIARELAASSALGLRRGLTAGADTARLESDVASAQAELNRIDTELRNSKRSLLILIGQVDAPTDSLSIEARLMEPPPVPAATPSALLMRRPDILAAQSRLIAAGSAVEVDRAALFPRIDLLGSGSLSRTSGALGGATALWSIGLGLSLPILDRARLLAQLRATGAKGEQAVIAYEAAVQDSFRDADITIANVAADKPVLTDLGRAAERARYAFDAARTGYRIGLTDLTTLLQSERSWRAAQAALTTARARALTNVVAAFRALGGGWSPGDPATAPGQPALSLPVSTHGAM